MKEAQTFDLALEKYYTIEALNRINERIQEQIKVANTDSIKQNLSAMVYGNEKLRLIEEELKSLINERHNHA